MKTPAKKSGDDYGWRKAVKELSKERAVEIVLEESQREIAAARNQGLAVGIGLGLLISMLAYLLMPILSHL